MKCLVLFLGIFFATCNPCKSGSQRCNGTVVEICRPDGKWFRVQDCAKLMRTKETFNCCCRTEDGKKKCGCLKGDAK